MEEFGFWIFILLMCVMFAGEPDLNDALVNYFNNQCESQNHDRN